MSSRSLSSVSTSTPFRLLIHDEQLPATLELRPRGGQPRGFELRPAEAPRLHGVGAQRCAPMPFGRAKKGKGLRVGEVEFAAPILLLKCFLGFRTARRSGRRGASRAGLGAEMGPGAIKAHDSLMKMADKS